MSKTVSFSDLFCRAENEHSISDVLIDCEREQHVTQNFCFAARRKQCHEVSVGVLMKQML